MDTAPELRFELERGDERERFWIRDDLYTAEPRTPLSAAVFNGVWDEAILWMAERLCLPTTRGYNIRTVQGYTYLGPLEVTDPEEVARRAEHFPERVRALLASYEADVAGIRAQQATVLARWRETALDEAGAIDLLGALRQAIGDLDLFQRSHILLAFPRHTVMDQLDQIGRETGAIVNTTELGRLCQATRVTQRDLYEERLWQLVGAASESGLAALLLERTAAELPSLIAAAPGGQAWWSQLAALVGDYDKLTVPKELASLTLAERPEPVLEQLRTYAALGEGEDAATRARARAADREAALAQVLSRLPDEAARQDLRRRADDTQRMQAELEDDNVPLLSMGAITRRVALAIGERLVGEGALSTRDDVFYLELEEVAQALRDAAAQTRYADLGERVAERRRLRERRRALQPPATIGQMPDKFDNFILNKFWGIPQSSREQSRGALRGVGASDGVVEGPAHVALTLDDLAGLGPGRILVVPATNPAWTHAFVRIAGIVTDQGGSLSHAAILAREYGIPAVLATQTATRELRTGQQIRIDGTNGTVEVL